MTSVENYAGYFNNGLVDCMNDKRNTTILISLVSIDQEFSKGYLCITDGTTSGLMMTEEIHGEALDKMKDSIGGNAFVL